jgi:N-acetylglucosaminyldiphosphoundecaprenol N-acetyl-beta-D-mannosaminyltransferase
MQEPTPSASCTVLGIRCFVGDVKSASGRVLARVRERSGGYVCQANAHVLVTAQHDEGVRTALENAWMVCPDGWPVAWLERRLGAQNASRIAGADLMTQVFEAGQARGLRHYLFGSTPAVLDALERALSVAHPRAQIVGTFSPPFGQPSEAETRKHVDRIREDGPDVVWCGLGAPKQELWMQHHAPSLAPAVVVGVGAAFDFHAGSKPRAPAWMQRAGLEWAHRLGSEPRRLAGRYARTNSEFMVRAALELTRRGRMA